MVDFDFRKTLIFSAQDNDKPNAGGHGIKPVETRVFAAMKETKTKDNFC